MAEDEKAIQAGSQKHGIYISAFRETAQAGQPCVEREHTESKLAENPLTTKVRRIRTTAGVWPSEYRDLGRLLILLETEREPLK